MESASTVQSFRSTDEVIKDCRVTMAEAQLARHFSKITRSETFELRALINDNMERLRAQQASFTSVLTQGGVISRIRCC